MLSLASVGEWADPDSQQRRQRASGVRQSSGPKGSEVFGTDDLDFGYSWGPAVGVYYCLNACNSIGVEYFAVDSWSASGVVAGNISVQFPSFPYLPELLVPGNPTTGYGVPTTNYDSRLYNAEVNLRHRSARPSG